MARILIEALLLAISLAMLFLSSLSEAALVTSNPVRLRAMEDRDNRARLAGALLQNRQEVLGTLIICLNFSMIVISALVADLALTWNEEFLPLAAAISLVAILLLGEITPKTLAVRRPEDTAVRTAGVVALLHRALMPVTSGLTRISRALLRSIVVPVLGGHVEAQVPSFSDEELKELVAVSEAEGEVAAEEKVMIHGVIELANKAAHELMVPRTDMNCLPESAGISEAVSLSQQHGHSRIPIYKDSVDNITGVVYIKDLAAHVSSGEGDPCLREVARAPYFVPESKNVAELLREMQVRRVHMAIVLDEHGGTAGLVTIEGLLEQVVGDIMDEYDTGEQPDIIRIDENSAVLDARTAVDKVEQEFQVELAEGGYDSIAGFLLAQLGRMPNVGERVRAGNMLFTVEAVNQNRIERIRALRLPNDEGQDEGKDKEA
jgi:putative hemolysin